MAAGVQQRLARARGEKTAILSPGWWVELGICSYTNFVVHEVRGILCPMKNVTITMDDAVAEWVRVEAAKRGSSVSRLLGEWLAEKMRQEDAYAQAMREALGFESWGASTRPYLARPELMKR
jgi:hypothetical protein